GELWALPAMLRLALVESVRRMTLRTVRRLDDLDAAEAWAARFHDAEGAGPTQLAGEVVSFARSVQSPSPDLGVQLHRQLRRNESPAAQDWLERWLREEGQGLEEEAARVTQRLAISQVTMSNSINSLRTVGGLDWNDVVESQSRLEATLREDPAGVY